MINISQASDRSGLPPKTIRYYEDIGLFVPVRGQNGYRAFSEENVQMLHFLKRARDLGFTIDDCRALLGLYTDRNRASAEVKAIAQRHLKQVDLKIEQLKSMRKTLGHLVDACDGDHRPSCPILDNLAGEQT